MNTNTRRISLLDRFDALVPAAQEMLALPDYFNNVVAVAKQPDGLTPLLATVLMLDAQRRGLKRLAEGYELMRFAVAYKDALAAAQQMPEGIERCVIEELLAHHLEGIGADLVGFLAELAIDLARTR